MNAHAHAPVARKLARAAALSPVVLLPLAATPALAEAPEQWETTPSVSALDMLLVLVAIPLGLALVISLLTVLPSLAKGESRAPGQPWRGEGEWFGGPRGGVESTDEVTPEAIEAGARDRGGASARW